MGNHWKLVGAVAAAMLPMDAHAEASTDGGSGATGGGGTERGTHGSAALLLGNGFEDGVNLGIGARAGAHLDALYLGGTFVYHFGESRSSTFLGQRLEASVNVYYFGGEVGYELPAGPVVLRPYAGLGLGTARGCLGDSCDTESRVYVAPGLVLLYPVGPVQIGADVRYVQPLDDDGTNFDHFGLFATAALEF